MIESSNYNIISSYQVSLSWCHCEMWIGCSSSCTAVLDQLDHSIGTKLQMQEQDIQLRKIFKAIQGSKPLSGYWRMERSWSSAAKICSFFFWNEHKCDVLLIEQQIARPDILAAGPNLHVCPVASWPRRVPCRPALGRETRRVQRRRPGRVCVQWTRRIFFLACVAARGWGMAPQLASLWKGQSGQAWDEGRSGGRCGRRGIWREEVSRQCSWFEHA